MKKWLREVDQWWFGAMRAESIGLLRILLSFIAFFNLLLLSFDFSSFFSRKGFISPTVARLWMDYGADRVFTGTPLEFKLPFHIPQISFITPDSPDSWMLFVFIVTIVCALLFMVGLWSRVTGLILALGLISLHTRNPSIIHAGDTLMRLMLIYLALGKSGAAYSIDRWLAIKRGKIPPSPEYVSAWPQRLIQFQIALCYFISVWLKWTGNTWQNGTATWYSSQLHEFDRFPVPSFMERQPVIGLTTYATLIVELSLATLVFYRPWRKWVLVSGVMLHSYIEYRFNIPFFAITIVTSYIAFYDGEEVDAWLKRKLARWWPAAQELSREAPG